MINGFTIKLPNGKYYQNSQSSTNDITKAKIYQNLGTLLKYAIKPKYVHHDMIDGNIQLIQVKEDEDSISVIELGAAWSCYHLYSMGYNVANETILNKDKIKKALKCLEDNGIERDECETVLQALCFILVDKDIEDY